MLHFFCLENQIVLLSESLNGEKVPGENGFAKSSVSYMNLKMLDFYKMENNSSFMYSLKLR